MSFSIFRRLLLNAFKRSGLTIQKAPPLNRQIEQLEDRAVPATYNVLSVALAPSADLTTDNDYTRINDAIQAAASGDTIILQGTFNWTETNAAASWAKGSDGVADVEYIDDYSIRVPAGRDGITITASSLGAATIQGPGDLANFDFEGVLYFDGSGQNQDWTISNIRFLDFDGAIQMFPGDVDTYQGTTITNNLIRVPKDLAIVDDEEGQNIGILYSLGKDQTISNNTIQIDGGGVSVGGITAASYGIQSSTYGGDVYDGLQITGNKIQVMNAQSASPENVIGIWENGQAHDSNITVSNNSFTNLAAGNNRTLNLQSAFRVTSHSGFESYVTYSNNTVSGANIGFQWLPEDFDADLSWNYPVELVGNTIANTNTGVLVQSGGTAHLFRNTITGGGTGVDVERGELLGPDCGCPPAVEENIITGNTIGILVGVDVSYVGDIYNNNISNTTNLRNDAGFPIDASGNWWGSNVVATVTAKITDTFDSVDYSPFLNTGADTSATQGFQGNFGNLTVHTAGQQWFWGRLEEGVEEVLPGGTLVVQSDGTADTFTVAPQVEGTDITWEDETVPVFGLGTLTLNGNDGNDTFIVALPPFTDIGTLNLNGGNPITFPGDTLTLDITGTNATVFGGSNGNAIAAGRASTYWTSIETAPRPTYRGQFDFQPTAAAPIQPGSVGVFPGTSYTEGLGYGWTRTPGRTTDAGALPSLAGNPLAAQLRDYMSDFGGLSSAGIFRVDLPSNAAVQFTAFLGDASTNLDGLEVAYSTNGVNYTPITPGGGLSLPAGKFTSVTSGSVIPGGTSEWGMLWVRFQDIGGTTSNWSASGLVVRPVTSVGALTVTPPTQGLLAADALSVDTFTVAGATPGALLTISATLGTILTDVRPEVVGNQVIADAEGNATFQIRRPYLSGTSTITVKDFTGAATGSTTQAYSLPTQWKFDMNYQTPSLPDASWFDVRTTSIYSPTVGYGWTSSPLSATDTATNYPAGSTAAQQALYRDYHSGTGTNTFKAYVGAGNTVDVTIYRYTPSLATTGMGVSLEGGAYQSITANNTTFRVNVGGDGILDIAFRSASFFSNWAVNAIEIHQVI